MKQKIRIILFLLLGVGLVLIRYFEQDFFSDPLLSFYKTKTSLSEPPKFITLQLIATTTWRFILNTILSLAIVWVVFLSRKLFLFSLIFYGIAYLVLISAFWFFISPMSSQDDMIVFYIRRFLIQPIFVLILLPAFYYQNKNVKEE